METNEILIYTAGKTWAGHGFKEMAELGYNLTARWIRHQQILADASDSFSDEVLHNEEEKRKIWDEGCKIDCGACDMGILYGREEDGNLHSGSLVELGHITASQMYTGIRKPVYVIGDCESFRPVGNSDRAWKSQAIVHCFPKIRSMAHGFQLATEHYRDTYTHDWHKSRQNTYHAALRAQMAA